MCNFFPSSTYLDFEQADAAASRHPSDNVRPNLPYPGAVQEWPFETARVITSLMSNGVFKRYPNIRWIMSHMGGVFPFLHQRVQNMVNTRPWFVGAKSAVDIFGEHPLDPLAYSTALKNVYWDTAQSSGHQFTNIKAMEGNAVSKKIVFGTDFPYQPANTGPEQSGLFDEEAMERIRWRNMLEMMPRVEDEWKKTGTI